MSVGDISSLVAVVASLMGIFIALRKAPGEVKQLQSQMEGMEADTTAKYQAIADRAADKTMKLDQEISGLKAEISVLEKKMKEIEEQNCSMAETVEWQGLKIGDLKRENDELRIWAARLAQQVIEAGKIPVTMSIKEEVKND